MELINLIVVTMPNAVEAIHLEARKDSDQITVFVKDYNLLINLVRIFRDHSRFLFLSLVDITAVDWLGFVESEQRHLSYNSTYYGGKFGSKKERFQLVYSFLSHYFNQRLMVSFFIESFESVYSITNVFESSNWLEREVWDMFGIFFLNHPDLRRILTDYGFNGFPLRKDFPVTGYEETRYDEAMKGLVYEPVELSQEMRNFDALTPWVGSYDFFGNIFDFVVLPDKVVGCEKKEG